jgi:hypothetical protein
VILGRYRASERRHEQARLEVQTYEPPPGCGDPLISQRAIPLPLLDAFRILREGRAPESQNDVPSAASEVFMRGERIVEIGDEQLVLVPVTLCGGNRPGLCLTPIGRGQFVCGSLDAIRRRGLVFDLRGATVAVVADGPSRVRFRGAPGCDEANVYGNAALTPTGGCTRIDAL